MGFRLFISLSVSVAVYFLLNVFFGAQGMLSYQELLDYRDRLSHNIEQMEDTRSRLTARAEELRTSAEAVRLEARELGYYEPGEQPVRVDGFSQQAEPIQAGKLLAPPSPADRQPLFRVAALSSGLIAFFLLLL